MGRPVRADEGSSRTDRLATDVLALRTLVVGGLGRPPEDELRRLIATDAVPDIVSSEDAIGATVLDDHYFAAVGGLRGRVLRRLPLILAQLIEVLLQARRYDAVLTWSDHRAICIGGVMRFWSRRPAHVAVLMWPSVAKKAILLRFTHRGIDRLIVRAPLQRRFAEGALSIPPDRFMDVRKAVDTTFWRPTPGARDLICSVGQEMRDYATLIEALEPLGIPCHIAAGTGMWNTPTDKWWTDSLTRRDLPPGVTFGQRSFLELRALYARARIVVVPLLPSDSDNGINTIVEAFAMGKPVICTDTLGQIGVLQHDVNCLRVPPFDVEALRKAIWELWNDPERCEEFGAAGRSVVVQRHGVDQWTAGLVQAVREATAVRAATGRSRTAAGAPLLASPTAAVADVCAPPLEPASRDRSQAEAA